MLVSTRTIATVAERQSSYLFASGTAPGAVSERVAGAASGLAMGTGSGEATAREKNMMATAAMALRAS